MNRHALASWLVACILSLVIAGPDGMAVRGGEGLTEDKQKNAEYRSWKYGKVLLKDGRASSLPEETVMLSEKPNAMVFGDLNGDGVDDAAVVLWSFYHASACAVELVAMINHKGVPRQAHLRQLRKISLVI